MQVSSSSYASLLDYINSQSDDTSSKGLGKAGGISSLLQQNCVASNPVLTKMSREAEKSGIYKSTVTNTGSVLKYLETLTDKSSDSCFFQSGSRRKYRRGSDEDRKPCGKL